MSDFRSKNQQNSFLSLTLLFHILNFNYFFVNCALNFGNETLRIRQRRGLIFEDGGVNKMIFGAIYPLYLEDRIKWRQLNCGYNIQAQYSVPTSPLYIWDKWEGRTLKSVREKFDKDGSFVPDESRKFLYIALETFMTQKGKNGRKCLLRVICENAQVDEPIGIFAEILHTILTPGKEELHDDYRDAYNAGKEGIDCLSLYPQCPKGDAFIDSIAVDVLN